MTATHTQVDGYLMQDAWITNGSLFMPNWTKHKIAGQPGHNFCEASICKVENEYFCLLRENSQRGDPLYYSWSDNSGKNWISPIRTRMFGGHRPTLGQLQSGDFLVTYREQMHPHIPNFWAKNTFACLTVEKSMRHRGQPCLKSIILPLDHDCAKRSDSGYTGWVETEDGQIYIVNYITNDAPKPYIVWYLIDEHEF